MIDWAKNLPKPIQILLWAISLGAVVAGVYALL